MGKARKKKEKKADFTVNPTQQVKADFIENKTKSRQDQTKAGELHRHFFQIPEYRTNRDCRLTIGIALSSQALDNAFLEGEARRSAAFEHQLAMTKHYAENQRKGYSYNCLADC